jgi:short-subunit dehydrogenase
MSSVKLALITGATSGLGKELVHQLSLQGVSLLLTGRDQDKLETLSKELHVPTIFLAADLSIANERQALIQLIKTHAPDLIINNAGYGLYGDALSTPTQEQIGMIDLNITALVEISLEAARALIKQGKRGTIMNISSASAFFPYPTFAIYAASKTFVNHFSEAFDEELTSHGIRVLTACPGSIQTSFRKRASHDFPQKKQTQAIPVHRAAQLILEQIEAQRRIKIIDWRYRLVVALARLLPRPLLMSLLKKQIADRYNAMLIPPA